MTPGQMTLVELLEHASLTFRNEVDAGIKERRLAATLRARAQRIREALATPDAAEFNALNRINAPDETPNTFENLSIKHVPAPPPSPLPCECPPGVQSWTCPIHGRGPLK